MAARPARVPKMPGGKGLCATMPRPFRKIERYSSISTAIEIAWRSVRARSEVPPTTGSFMLNPK
jgi:hypothetical protein